jgi:cobalt/nickel transport system permease protein
VNVQFDTLAYSNRLRHLPPSQKLWFAVGMLLLALISHYPVQLAIFGWMSVWITVYAGIPVAVYRSMIGSVLIFFVTSLPALVIEYVGTISPTVQPDVWWQMSVWGGHLYLSQLGLIRAMATFSRSLASISALFFIVLTIPMIDLATICQKLRCPPILIELSLLIYRCIFLLADTAQTIVTAQVARGGYRTNKLRMNSLGLLVRQLLQRTVVRYQQLTLGITARGFQQEFRFWQPNIYKYSHRYGWEAIGGGLLLVIGEICYRSYV